MNFLLGSIVKSMAGSDNGTLYLVVENSSEHFLLLADGKRHGWNKLKRKNRKHCVLVESTQDEMHRLAEQVGLISNTEDGRQINAQIRRLLRTRRVKCLKKM